MARVIDRAAKRARRLAEEAELHILAAEGRRSIATKIERAKRVTKKALKAGAIAGAVVATAVVVREIRKRRKRDA